MATNTDSTTPPPDYETLIDLSDIDMSSLEFTGVYHSSLGFDFPGTEHRQTAAADRRVKIIIKDGHDDKGPGMTFEIKYFAKLQAAFDCFKAASCKTCRAIDDIRFKTVEKRIDEFDTPKKLGLKQNTTTEIRAWSNVPGLQCSGCKFTGYPKTNGVVKPTPPSKLDTTTTSNKPETITLLVKDQTGFETNVKMLDTVSMEYLMDTYAERSLRTREHVRFLFDGERLVKTGRRSS